MLTRLRIENYRSLQDVTIDFAPLTVLVGANGSGKSAILSALSKHLTVSPSDVWRRQPATNVTRTVSVNGVSERNSMGQGSAGSITMQTARVHFRLDVLRASNVVAEARTVGWDGTGLANAFATLTRKTQQDVVKQLCDRIPLFQDVHTRPGNAGSGTHRLVFQDRWAPNVWYEPSEVSDGTILLFAFLVVAHAEDTPDLLCIEEPEHGLHPYLLRELVNLLRQLSRGELGGKAVQIVLATQSAELLRFVEPAEVRFVSRDLEDGATRVRSVEAESPAFRDALAAYDGSLADLWLSGALGGVPAIP